MKLLMACLMYSGRRSPPARGRGLKQETPGYDLSSEAVAPRAGAWIETIIPPSPTNTASCRPPRGGVD